MSSQGMPWSGTDLDLALEGILNDDLQFLPFDGEVTPDEHGDLGSAGSDHDSWWLQPQNSQINYALGEQSNSGPLTSGTAPEPEGSTTQSLPITTPITGEYSPIDLQTIDSNHNSPFPAAMWSENMFPNTADRLNTTPPPKMGGRFSRDSVQILKGWLLANTRNPYPRESEKKCLQRQTGLSKTQITNWLANARRRGKIQASRPASPLVQTSWSKPMDIPPRQATPALRSNPSHMNPLERWVESPPENEPATVTAIARAVASSSRLSTNKTGARRGDLAEQGSDKSFSNLSRTNSLDTSRSSGGSLASANSYGSRASFGSFGPFSHSRSRRKRRAVHRRMDEKTPLAAPLKTFQCTFCTETFKTKHDWQRHENSLHLPLERWICTPDGPSAYNSVAQEVCCVFCGHAKPDEVHFQSHNHSTCQERSIQERIFNRKDHLNQHLRLVHNVKFIEWSMKSWKVEMPAIRSRCGFCGVFMDTWDARVYHLADHFKAGRTMAEWKGNWGFDAHILELVENSIPPFLIETERNTPFPFEASNAPAESPRSAYELIKLELAYFMQNYFDRTRQMPNSEEMQLEACRIVLASEALSRQEVPTPFSWLRDLIMSDNRIVQRAKFSPLRSSSESRLFALKINGKNDMFEGCLFETQLQDFVQARRLLGLSINGTELKEEACLIVGRIEEVSATPSDFIATWLVKLVQSSVDWLASFCQRAQIPQPEQIIRDHVIGSGEYHTIPSSIHEYTRLDRDLLSYLNVQRAIGIEPDDADLRQQARIIVSESNDGWGQTAADDTLWLSAFKRRHRRDRGNGSQPSPPPVLPDSMSISRPPTLNDSATIAARSKTRSSGSSEEPELRPYSFLIRTSGLYLNDPNFYRWLGEELSRWVAATMSPENPTCHVPSDQEIQHYARWIGYNE
ncbi:Fc.00g104450.m01.CDS01 [Cosmosporella sp. VM-42]